MPSNLSSMIADRVAETTTTTGTLSVTLAGAKAGYRAFADALPNVAEVYYCITDGTEFEVGVGTYSSGEDFSRDTVLSSSNWGSLVDWPAGSKDIFCTLPAEIIGKFAETFEEEITVTVGDLETQGADFSSIEEALAYLSHLKPTYDQGGIPATIELQTGFIMSEQIAVSGIDLGWITITSVDAEVELDVTALITQYFCGKYAAFAVRDGVGPTISCLFAATGALSRAGVAVVNGIIRISAGSGIKDCGDSGLHVEGASRVIADGAVFSGSGNEGINVSGPSTVSAIGADCSGSSTGISATGGAQVAASDSDLSGCISSACYVESAVVDITNAYATDAGGDAVVAESGRVIAAYADLLGAFGTAVVVSSGGMVIANGTGTVTLSQTENTITADGIIFREIA